MKIRETSLPLLLVSSIVAIVTVVNFQDPRLSMSIFASAIPSENKDHIEPTYPEYKEPLLKSKEQSSTHRLLTNDETCSNVCNTDEDADAMQSHVTQDTGNGPNTLLSSRYMNVEVIDEEDEEDEVTFPGILGRLLNRLLRFVFRRSNGPTTKYVVPTRNIVPVLSNYSAKFKSLSELIRLESAYDAALSSQPDVLQRMYTLSADNMASISSLFDPIISVLEDEEAIDLSTLGCIVKQIVSVLHDVTIPNIELMMMILYTKTSNSELENTYNTYLAAKSNVANMEETSGMSSSGSHPTTSAQSKDQAVICANIASRTAAIVEFRTFSMSDVIRSGEVGGILQNIFYIIILVVFFPLSIVIGVVSSILALIGGIFLVILSLFGVTVTIFPPAEPTDDDTGIGDFIRTVLPFLLLLAIVGAPITTIVLILGLIGEVLNGIIGLIPVARFSTFPTQPIPPSNPSFIYEPSNRSFFVSTPINTTEKVPAPAPISRKIQSRSSPRDATKVNNLLSRVKGLLQSPIDTIVDAMQLDSLLDGYRFIDKESKNEMDCEMEALICKNDEVLMAFPF